MSKQCNTHYGNRQKSLVVHMCWRVHTPTAHVHNATACVCSPIRCYIRHHKTPCVRNSPYPPSVARARTHTSTWLSVPMDKCTVIFFHPYAQYACDHLVRRIQIKHSHILLWKYNRVQQVAHARALTVINHRHHQRTTTTISITLPSCAVWHESRTRAFFFAV